MKIPPAPTGTPFGSYTWADWYYKITALLNNTLFNHNDLQNIQGGNTNERYHLTAAEYNKAKNAMSIKSIQRGTIAITGTNTTATVSITSVDTSKTELRYLGITEASTDSGAYIALTSSTQITATRAAPTASHSVTVSWELTEWQ